MKDSLICLVFTTNLRMFFLQYPSDDGWVFWMPCVIRHLDHEIVTIWNHINSEVWLAARAFLCTKIYPLLLHRRFRRLILCSQSAELDVAAMREHNLVALRSSPICNKS